MNIFRKAWNRIFGAKQTQQRGFRELVGLGGINKDWTLNGQSDDADMWINAYALTTRVRDLFKTNPMYQAYRETLWANVFGSEGLMLRMKVKEQEDRVIHSADEKSAFRDFDKRRNRVAEYVAKRNGLDFTPHTTLQEFGTNGSRVAQVKVGEPDVFANQLIERKWKEWQRKEFCDVRGTRNYQTIRQLRLIGAVRDGDFFIRLIRDTRANKFGFTLQMINAEWCDRFFNATLENGNEVRMGIEYEFSPWGLGRVVAYHFIKRQPKDWQWQNGGLWNMSSGGGLHDRVDARDIVHYARPVDADSTRPAPWVASTIPKSRQLDQYELAEVVAARAQACKTGWLYSDVNPEGGASGVPIDPATGLPSQPLGPGDIGALPWGVKYQSNDPTHPNGNFENFRQGMVRSLCAGMPGANYATIANDYASINFSAGRLQRLDSNELYKLIQQFDIDTAEIPIFEAWLEMALLTGQVALPLAKFQKFNKPVFQGRRWGSVDEIKEVTAAALRVANGFSSDQRECAAFGVDLEDILFEQAESNMLKDELGIGTTKTVESSGNAPANADAADAAESAQIQGTGLNGAQIEALLSIVNRVTTGEIDIATANALIAAAFPLMTPAEVSAITAHLEVMEVEEPNETETEKPETAIPAAKKQRKKSRV